MTDKIKRAVEMMAEELFDKHSELIGTDISELEDFAGRCVVKDRDFKKAITEAVQSEAAREYWEQQGWVRVEDGLPDDGIRVFVCDISSGFVDKGFILKNRWEPDWSVGNFAYYGRQITHWRPLPPPPKQ